MKSLILVVSTLAFIGCGGSSGNADGGMTGCTTFGSVCLYAPATPAARTQCGNVTEYCDKTSMATPNLACLATPLQNPAAPAAITMTGFIHVFSSGPDSTNLSVAVYDAAPLLAGTDIKTATPIAQGKFALDPTTQRACDTDKANGCSIPSLTDCAVPVCGDGLMGRPNDKKYCRVVSAGNFVCSDRLRWEARYTFDNIPTNKQLAIRVTGPDGVSDQVWATTVQFNVYLPSGAKTCGDKSESDCLDNTDPMKPKFQYNVNALTQSDYVNIPQTSGLAGGISAGLGAVAGEVHDCDNIRVGNVAVATNPPGDRFTYFNGNPVMTLPDPARIAFGTDQLGLYAAFNIKPGKVTSQAAGLSGATLVDFGSFDGIIYPDTVSIVNINGGRPKP
jgi:hypothetical protein